ncbi:MAG: putative addiction module antidote protein [Holosporaceae bacterium]|nr:putative addiction module antidote protein [Holosporaceae bacterium]
MTNKYQTFSELLVNKLKNDKELAEEFLRAGMEDYSENLDKEELLLSLKHLAEAKGVSKLAKEAGISRDVFYKSLLPNGNPKIDTLLAILKALKYTITFKPIKHI